MYKTLTPLALKIVKLWKKTRPLTAGQGGCTRNCIGPGVWGFGVSDSGFTAFLLVRALLSLQEALPTGFRGLGFRVWGTVKGFEMSFWGCLRLGYTENTPDKIYSA